MGITNQTEPDKSGRHLCRTLPRAGIDPAFRVAGTHSTNYTNPPRLHNAVTTVGLGLVDFTTGT